jgi:cell division protein FtsN
MLSPRLTRDKAAPQPGGNMVRRELPPTSRIFLRKKRSAWSRLAGSAVLTLSLGVMAFGIGTAVYLDRSPTPHSAPATGQTATALPLLIAPPAPPRDPLAANAAVLAPAPAPAPATLAKIEPEAGPSAPAQSAAPLAVPAPSKPLAAIPPAPPEAPPATTRPPAQYWVEYAVYRGTTYAERLQQALARKGLSAVIVKTHGRRGIALLRVRSLPTHDLAAARRTLQQAKTALRIAPLLHYGSPTAAPRNHYWVQFGAFRKVRQATVLRHRLARAGIVTTLRAVRGSDAKFFYLVRSEPLATHAMALAIAAQAQPVTRIASLIGVTPRSRQPGLARAPPRHVADSR